MSGAIGAKNVSINGEPTGLAVVHDRLSRAVARLRDKGARVILLEQGPTLREDASRYLLQNSRHGLREPLTVSKAEFIGYLRQARALADVVDLYVETADLFCRTTVCPSVDAKGRLVIYDAIHVTRLYSEKLGVLVGQAGGL